MANVNFNDVDNYAQQGSKTGFFSLQNDKDSARVRFMFSSGADLEILTCHELMVGGNRRKVNCLKKSWNSPVDECPLCASGNRPSVKYYLPLYKYEVDPNTGAVVGGQLLIWERGASFKEEIQALISRFPNLPSHVFDIIRQGAKSDMKTRYNIWPLSDQESAMYPCPPEKEVSNITKALGTIVADRSAEEIQYAMQYGQFPDAANTAQPAAPPMGQRPAYTPPTPVYAPPQTAGPSTVPPAMGTPPTTPYAPPATPTQPYGGIPQGGRRS